MLFEESLFSLKRSWKHDEVCSTASVQTTSENNVRHSTEECCLKTVCRHLRSLHGVPESGSVVLELQEAARIVSV